MKRSRPAFTLVELLLLLLPAMILLLALMSLGNQFVYLQRLASQHAARIAAMDSLMTRLQRDALEAHGHTWDGPRNTGAVEKSHDAYTNADAADNGQNGDAADERGDKTTETARLTLEMPYGRVVYRFRPRAAERSASWCEPSEWSATRLRLEWQWAAAGANAEGPGRETARYALLMLRFIEEPPPRGTVLKDRVFSRSVLLPLER